MSAQSQPQLEHARCPHDGYLIGLNGRCWFCGQTPDVPTNGDRSEPVPANPQVEMEVEPVSNNASVPSVQEQVLNAQPLTVAGADGEAIQLSLFGAMAARYRVASTEIKFGGSVEQISDTLRRLTGRDIEPGDTLDLTVRVDVGAITTKCKDDIYSTAMKMEVTHLFDAKVQQSAEEKMRARIEAAKRLEREIRESEERKANRRDLAVVRDE